MRIHPIISSILFSATLFAGGGDRSCIYDTLPKNGIGAEIGVWTGLFSLSLIREVSPRHLYLIDPWVFVHDYPRSLEGGLSKRVQGQQDMDAVYQGVTKRFQKHNNVTIMRMYSDEAALEFDDEFFDWIYIDGDHRYEGVYADLVNYWPKVKKGGWITGDDYSLYEGVQKAVDQFVNEMDIDDLQIVRAQFMFKKK